MYIYDTKKRQKVKFEPREDGKVSIYLCGPTVYDDAHIGHARSALVFDLLRRTLMVMGYEVKFVRNFTDIDDKIIKRVKSSGERIDIFTQRYIERYKAQMRELGVLDPDMEPRATEYMDAMIQMIKRLEYNSCAYRTQNGDLYFDTSKDEKYGTLSCINDDEDRRKSRVDHDQQKRNLRDFALWKSCKSDDDICFNSPYGQGRPGWHIECSAMIEECFDAAEGYSIDIHCGGADLLFPHHENEAAQSRCATGHELAKYWVHNGFVRVGGEKMSKSLGNSFFLRDALNEYDAEVLRYYLAGVHYRNELEYSDEDIKSAKKRLDRLYRLKKRLVGIDASVANRDFSNALLDAMRDDLNISVALSVIDEMISQANDMLDEQQKEKDLKKSLMANIEFISRLLGFGAKDPFVYFQAGVDEETKEYIEVLIQKRLDAKKERNFKEADSIRDELVGMGVSIMDTKDGTSWEKI